MALIEMNFASGGGGTLNPTFTKNGTTKSFSAVVGKHYIIIGWASASSATNTWNGCDITSMTGGTYEKLGNAYTDGTHLFGATYSFVTATATTISFTTSGSPNFDIVQLD